MPRSSSRVRNAVRLYLAQRRQYWATRKVLQKIAFRTSRQLFGFRHRVLEGKIRARSTWSLFWLCLGQLLKALILACLILATNEIPASVLPSWLPKLNGDTYTNLLATITGIGGVFIGLYYTAISLVASTAYAKVPNNIRDLLAHERIGNAYMRSLSLLTVLGVFLLVGDALGYPPLALAVPIFAVWSAFAIFAFVTLGARAFDLFDPSTLSHNLFEQLQRTYNRMRAGGYKWNDPTFQNHAHRTAYSALETMLTLTEMTEKEPHLSGQPFASLSNGLISFLVRYEDAKKEIPTNSRWYGQKLVHPEWYQSPDSTVSIVHQAASTLEPTSQSDPRWMEDRILPVICRCLVANLKLRREELVQEVLLYVSAYVEKLAFEGELEAAFELVDDVFDSIAQFLLQPREVPEREEPLTRFGILDQVASMPITILTAYRKSLEDRSSEAMQQRLADVNWSRTSAIYKAGFPRHSLKQLEWLQKRLSFELEVEGKVFSPIWYLHDLMRLDWSQLNEQALRNLYSKACEAYKKWTLAAVQARHPWLTAAIATREWEYWNKLRHHEASMIDYWTEYLEPGKVKDLPWPTLKVEEHKQKVDERRLDLLGLMCAESFILLRIDRPDTHPDFAGQFLHTVGEALISAMYANRPNEVQFLFRHYLSATLMLFNKIFPDGAPTDLKKQMDLKIAVAPLLDLMDVSGYAYLYAAYYEEDALSEAISEAWDEYLNNKSQGRPRLSVLAAALSLTENSFELAHRSLLRAQWQQLAKQRFDDLEREEAFHQGSFGLSGDQYVMHNDPLVRVFAADEYPFYDGIDVFIGEYLRSRDEYETVDFSIRQHRDLMEAIEREVERFESLGGA